MKKLLATTAISGCLAALPALAEPSFMIGLTMGLGGGNARQVGVTAQVLSTNQRDSWAAAAGVTYFPGANSWGLDAGVGYNFRNETLTLTYDFLNEGLNLSAGWAQLGADDGIGGGLGSE